MIEDVLGCKWSLAVIDCARRGVVRPGEMERVIGGIRTKVLNERLRKLVRYEILAKYSYAEVPPRVEYRLTDLGHSLGEAFCGVWHWAGDNLDRVEAARKAFDDRG